LYLGSRKNDIKIKYKEADEMSEKSWVDKNHYRITSEDGCKSWLYETYGIFGASKCVEVAEHYPDGTTEAWEADPEAYWNIFSNGKGKKK